MRQMLLSFLSRERREAVMPYVTTARVGEDVITVETPEKNGEEADGCFAALGRRTPRA